MSLKAALPTNFFWDAATGQAGIMWRNPYRICIMLAQIFFNIGFGGGEGIFVTYVVYRFHLFLLPRATMLFWIVLLLEVSFMSSVIGVVINTKFIVPKLGLVNTILLNGIGGAIFSVFQAYENKLGSFMWLVALGNIVGAATRALIGTAYFSQGSEMEKSQISASFRFAESGGKVSGKLVVGGIYLPWFISKGGMLCGFKLVDINAGLWDNDETNAMKQNDPNCKVGLFGGTFGSGEPWAILAIAWTLSTVFVIIAQKFKQHDNYTMESKVVEVAG